MQRRLARLSMVLGAAAVAALLLFSEQRLQAQSAPGSALQTGRELFEANCAACHGSDGQGGIGPNLQQIAARRSFSETVAFVEHPVGPMPKLYPERLSATQVRDVVLYIRSGFHLSPAPRESTLPYTGYGYGRMGPGMTYGYGPGGYGPGMMRGNAGSGGGMMGGYGYSAGRTSLDLSVADVTQYFRRWLAAEGNPHVRLGTVQAKSADTILVDIVTTSGGSLVVRYAVDRHTGYITPR